jgi:SAM domain (Sterile alpha motif)
VCATCVTLTDNTASTVATAAAFILLTTHTQTVTALLSRLGLSKYATALLDAEVDMQALVLFEEADFRDLGLPKGPRIKASHIQHILYIMYLCCTLLSNSLCVVTTCDSLACIACAGVV